MKSFRLSKDNTPHLTSFIHRYLNGDPVLSSFYNNSPTLEGIKKQIQEKKFSDHNRDVLHKTLLVQYSGITLPEPVKINLNLLLDKNTFTITTGHQPNFCTGPLYVLIKIAYIIKLSKLLNEKLTDFHFVPVYWMNSEDHDKEELNHFYIENKKISWDTDQVGPFGEFNTEGLKTFFENISETFPAQANNIKWVSDFYLSSKNVAEGMRKIINYLFGEDGLIIIDGNSKELKKNFENPILEELENSVTYKHVLAQNKILSEFVEPPVNPREINLFLNDTNFRERIVLNGEEFHVFNSKIKFTHDEIKKVLINNPEKFSPNVLLRPLYQEMVLPNIVFAGGVNEITYWFQLKNLFNHFNIPFPVLMVRNSFTLMNSKINGYLEKHEIPIEKIFPTTEIKNYFIEKNTSFQHFLEDEKKDLILIYERIRNVMIKYDKNLVRTVEGEKLKTLDSLVHFEKKARKVWENHNQSVLIELDEIANWIYPEKILQERKFNFLSHTEITPLELCKELIKNTEPFDYRHIVLEFEN